MTLLDIDIERSPRRAIVRIGGELDLSSEVELREALAGIDEPRLDLDLSRLSYCDSCGVSALVEAHKNAVRAGREFYICAAASLVRDVLTICGVLPALACPDEH